jgi:hypothetical protein
VSDPGFDFRPPSPRRVPRRFEPPPWERDQFEKRAREQAEREKAEKEALLAAQEAERAGQPGPQDSQVAENTAPATERLDEKQVDLMMLTLRAEESENIGTVWLVGLSAGVLVGLIGIATVIWGAAALLNRKLGSVGTQGGMVLVVFGLTFVSIGGWAIYRSLRQRGVL